MTPILPFRRDAAALALAALAACGGGDEEAAPQRTRVYPDRVGKRIVATVDRLEIGRTADGFMLTALGATDGLGWTAAQLRPAEPPPGREGWAVFDLVALPPASPEGPPGARGAVRADTPLDPALVGQVEGVFVRALDGAVEGVF